MFYSLAVWFLSLSLCLSLFASFAAADYTSKLEQQLNLINQEYLTAGTTQPSDNSLGLTLWDDDAYTDAAVYFEAVIYCNACTGGNTQAVATLYTSGGSAVTGAVVSTTQSAYTLVRSAAITGNLTDDTQYTVRLTRDADTGAAYLKAARLIVLQSGTNLTLTQNQIEIGGSDTTASTAYEIMTNPKIIRFDADSFDPLSSVYFHAALAGDAGDTEAFAALSAAADCSTLVTDSAVSVTGTTWSLAQSGNLVSNLSDDTDYWVCLKTSAGGVAAIANAKLVINQSDADGLMKIPLHHAYHNTVTTDNDTAYTSQLFLNEYNPTNFDADLISVYLEATINSAPAGTGYLRLNNHTDTTALASTEISTDTAGFVRVRSASAINASLPTSAKTLDVQLKNSAVNFTSVTSSQLIIQLERIPDPEMSFTYQAVASGQTHNGITTSVTSSVDAIDFATLIPGTPKYAAHALTVTTNASSGYSVSLSLPTYLQGNYPANNIDASPGTWAAPAAWSTPTGTTANDNTGWFGANTSDTRIPAWADASAKFAGLGSGSYTVMSASGADTGTTVYVSYALEVNILQPPDGYTGTLIYNLLPTY